MVAFPAPSKYTLMFWQIAEGDTVSITVTTAIQFDEFVFPSVTVNVTLFGPRSAQVNVVCDALNVIPEQLSVEPPSISAATIVAFPAPSKYTLMF